MLKDLFTVWDKKKQGSQPVKRYKPKKIDRLVNYLPWSYYVKRELVIDSETRLEMCIVIQKNGSIQQTYGFRGNDIESFSPEYVAKVFEFFNQNIKRLGDGWMISVEAQRFKMHDYPSADFDSLAGWLVDAEREKNFKSTGDHYDSVFYLNFVYQPEMEIKRKFLQLFYTQPVVENLMENEIKNFLKVVSSITSVLSGRMIIRPLDCAETMSYIHSTCSTTRRIFNLPRSFLFMDSYISDCKVEVGNTVRLGEEYIPIAEVYDFPAETYPAILNDLNKLDIEYRWVSRFFPLETDVALKELDKYQGGAAGKKKSASKMASEMALGYESSIESHAGVMAQSDVESAQEEIGGNVNSLGYYNSCVMVWDEDYAKSQHKIREVVKAIGQTGFGAKHEELGSFDAFLGMNAGNTTADIRRPLITSGNYTHTLPFSAIWAGVEHNKFLGDLTGVDKPLVTCSTNYGANFYLNLNDGDVGHTLILGPTGAGKSTLLNLLAASSLKYPDSQVFFMDYGLSSLTLTLAVGGTYINPADGSVCFQPLRDIDNENEFIWACNFIRTLIEIQGIEVNAQMEIAIEAAMNAVASMPVEMRNMTVFTMNLQYVDERGHKILDDVLYQYTIKGRFGKLFDGDHTSLGTSRWVLFEMESILDMGPLASAPAILFIFHFLEKSFTGRLTFFFMDECWFGLENPAIARKMKEYLLTLRKKNVFCIFATQNPAAVAESSLAETMIQNCPTKIFLADPMANQIHDAYIKLSLTEDEVMLLSDSTKKLDYYIKCTLGTRKFQLELGPLQLALFRNRESKFRTKDGEIIPWRKYLEYLLDIRTKKQEDLEFCAEILDIQGIEFRQYLTDAGYDLRDFGLD